MPCNINNNTSHDLTQLKDLVNQFLPFAQKRIGFNRPPVINFDSDEQNSRNPLGKTAQYDPSNMEISIFVDGRHIKDILRSLSHELVHHNQNCRGDFNRDISTKLGYAQNDKFLRKMEEEAYLQGNLCFRDWEDGIKTENKLLYETIYKDASIIGEYDMSNKSTKEWKDQELNNLLMKKWGFDVPKDHKLEEGIPTTVVNDYQTGQEVLGEESEEDDEKDDDEDEESSSKLHQDAQSVESRKRTLVKKNEDPTVREKYDYSDKLILEKLNSGNPFALYDKWLNEEDPFFLRENSESTKKSKIIPKKLSESKNSETPILLLEAGAGSWAFSKAKALVRPSKKALDDVAKVLAKIGGLGLSGNVAGMRKALKDAFEEMAKLGDNSLEKLARQGDKNYNDAMNAISERIMKKINPGLKSGAPGFELLRREISGALTTYSRKIKKNYVNYVNKPDKLGDKAVKEWTKKVKDTLGKCESVGSKECHQKVFDTLKSYIKRSDVKKGPMAEEYSENMTRAFLDSKKHGRNILKTFTKTAKKTTEATATITAAGKALGDAATAAAAASRAADDGFTALKAANKAEDLAAAKTAKDTIDTNARAAYKAENRAQKAVDNLKRAGADKKAIAEAEANLATIGKHTADLKALQKTAKEMIKDAKFAVESTKRLQTAAAASGAAADSAKAARQEAKNALDNLKQAAAIGDDYAAEEAIVILKKNVKEAATAETKAQKALTAVENALKKDLNPLAATFRADAQAALEIAKDHHKFAKGYLISAQPLIKKIADAAAEAKKLSGGAKSGNSAWKNNTLIDKRGARRALRALTNEAKAGHYWGKGGKKNLLDDMTQWLKDRLRKGTQNILAGSKTSEWKSLKKAVDAAQGNTKLIDEIVEQYAKRAINRYHTVMRRAIGKCFRASKITKGGARGAIGSTAWAKGRLGVKALACIAAVPGGAIYLCKHLSEDWCPKGLYAYSDKNDVPLLADCVAGHAEACEAAVNRESLADLKEFIEKCRDGGDGSDACKQLEKQVVLRDVSNKSNTEVAELCRQGNEAACTVLISRGATSKLPATPGGVWPAESPDTTIPDAPVKRRPPSHAKVRVATAGRGGRVRKPTPGAEPKRFLGMSVRWLKSRGWVWDEQKGDFFKPSRPDYGLFHHCRGNMYCKKWRGSKAAARRRRRRKRKTEPLTKAQLRAITGEKDVSGYKEVPGTALPLKPFTGNLSTGDELEDVG